MGAIDHPMVGGEIDLHLPLNGHGVAAGDSHHGTGGRHRQDGAGVGGQDSGKAIHAKHPQIGEGKGAAAVVLRLKLFATGAFHKVGPGAGEGIEIRAFPIA